MRGKTFYAAIAALAVAAAIQLVRPERTNPPENPAASFEAVASPTPAAAAVVRRACQDCHSHRTVWPWYSGVSPASWLVARDVAEGRARLNLSQWGYYGPEMSGLRMKAMCQEAREGDMPMRSYTLLHPGARLSKADVEDLCAAAPAPKL